MTDEKKVSNAALYWFNCNKDGFPTGQKKIFEEWLESNTQHKIAYQRLFRSQEIINTKKKPKKKRYILLYFILALLFIIMIITIRI